jgi:hypothetical protein
MTAEKALEHPWFAKVIVERTYETFVKGMKVEKKYERKLDLGRLKTFVAHGTLKTAAINYISN